MKLSGKLFPFLVPLGFCCAFWHVKVSFGGDELMPIEGLILPLQHYEDGTIKVQLKAGHAEVPEQGDIQALNTRVEFYTEEGNLDGLIMAGKCRYSRQKGIASSESKVRIEKGQLVITGTGFKWNAGEQVVRLMDNVKVVMSPLLTRENRSDLETADTVITSKNLTFDYKRSIAVFKKNVVMDDPKARIESDKLNVLFQGTNDVKSVTAVGNVRLWHNDKTATCQRAIYMAKADKVILTGDAKLNRDNDSLMGDIITFRLDEDKVSCKRARLIIFPEENRNG